MAVLSETIFQRLAGDVLSGRLAPGDPVPSERTLSDELGVNRHAIREALKRMQQAGLVSISQGGATRVLDWRRTAGLDLLVALARSVETPELLRDIVEMRASIGADVARLAAQRGARPPQPRTTPDGYIEFWEAIVDAAGNLAYRLAFNSLVAAQREGAIDARIYAPEYEDAEAQAALAAALGAGDAERAQRLARELLGRAVQDAA